jgi:3-hydroxybutyryl-CoA dehydrogenase
MNVEIKTIGVAGAGTMGSGIAQVFAQAGYTVSIYDQIPAMLQKAKSGIESNLAVLVSKTKITEAEADSILRRIAFTSDIESVKADFIIEAIIENLKAKQELFKKLSILNPASILATNTSTIPVTQIAFGLPHPERVIGVHFFNPAQIMKLVEIISGIETTDEIAQLVYNMIQKCGKSPIKAKDAPGFIVNRVARPFYTESQKLVEEQVASVEDLDLLLESAGFKMGPFKLMDLIGNDVNFSVTKSLFEQFYYESRFRPSRIQEQLVSGGLLGRKSGRGFYKY